MKPSSPSSLLRRNVEDYERTLILNELTRHHWNRTRTAKSLGISYRWLLVKIHRFKLIPPQDQFSGSSSS